MGGARTVFCLKMFYLISYINFSIIFYAVTNNFASEKFVNWMFNIRCSHDHRTF